MATAIIKYDQYKDVLNDAESLKKWAKENIMDAYTSSLDGQYYDTDLTGWEALFEQLTYEEDYEQYSLNLPRFISDEALYKIIRYENHRFNTSSKESSLDEFFEQGYYTYDTIDESSSREYTYTIAVTEVELDYPNSDKYPVEHLEYPKEIVLKFKRDDVSYEQLYNAVADKVYNDMDYGIDAPDAVDEVSVAFVDFDIVSIQ